jgi:hypothetical protein
MKRAYAHTASKRRKDFRWVWLLCILGAIILYWYAFVDAGSSLAPKFQPGLGPQAHAGDLMSIESIKTYSPAEATALIRQNYGAVAKPAATGITKVTFRYRSQLPGGQYVTEYARAYLPAKTLGKLPVFGFAPGTTGVGDKCAPSLEDIHKANWGDYDSHMTAYASQGYVAVTTDYEGMRDPERIHHYMVGELEGRAVLDSVRALVHIPQTNGIASLDQVFLGGYSQGGHAVFWADKIAAAYAPQVKVRGVVGWGPVLSVEETMADVTHGANINWFGPYVMYSYTDYYKANYDIHQVLQPRIADSLDADVPAHCIDSDIPHWGHNPAAVYTPEFLAAMATGKIAEAYPKFAAALAENAITSSPTATPKRINQGANDNVVLPRQAKAALPSLCKSGKGPVELVEYSATTHYDAMVHSFNDTLAWMQGILKGQAQPNSCTAPMPTQTPAATPVPTPAQTPAPTSPATQGTPVVQ